MPVENTKPYRILQVGMSDNYGGTEATVYSLYEKIDRSKLQFDFLNVYGHPLAKQDYLISLGARVFDLPLKRREGYCRYLRGIRDFYQAHAKDFDAVICNVQCLDQIDMARFAKKYGIKNVLIYSHNAGYGILPSRLAKIAIWWNKKTCHRYVDHYVACSQMAADFVFSKKDARKTRVINTGILTSHFAFDAEKRQQFRSQFGYSPEDHVYGSAGRFDPQKNQLFLIDVFSEIAMQDPHARFFLSGRGPLEMKIRDKIKEKNLESTCRLVTDFLDYQAFYSGLDAFLLPSIFEGLGVVLIEAQCAGLPCLASAGTVPSEAKILPNFVYVPLQAGPKAWAEQAITSLQGHVLDRSSGLTSVRSAGRDIAETSKLYERLFL
jgi:glycosyltransferase involved in cell wall biosynthesis